MASAVSQSEQKIITHKVGVLGCSVYLSLLLVACGNIEAEAIESPSYTQEDNEFIASNLSGESKIKESSRDTSPQKYLSPEQVISKLDSPVKDFTNTFNDYERKQLYRKLKSINDEGLLDVGLVVVPTTGNMSIYDYATKIADTWSLGTLKKNNGLLILMAMKNKEIYIIAGAGAGAGAGVWEQLDDKTLNIIIRNVIVPSFKEGNYEEGISRGLDALVSVFDL